MHNMWLFVLVLPTQPVVVHGENGSEHAGSPRGSAADDCLVRALGVPLQQHGQPASHHHARVCRSREPYRRSLSLSHPPPPTSYMYHFSTSQLVQLSEDVSLSRPCVRLKLSSTNDTSRKVYTCKHCIYMSRILPGQLCYHGSWQSTDLQHICCRHEYSTQYITIFTIVDTCSIHKSTISLYGNVTCS